MKDHPSQWIDSGLTCRDITERASAYLEDRLSMWMKIRVGFHLASCAWCRAYVLQVSLVRDTMGLFPKQLPPPINRLRQHVAAHHLQERITLR
jgi:predicted anti-sigma-YlaC factor YlaD